MGYLKKNKPKEIRNKVILTDETSSKAMAIAREMFYRKRYFANEKIYAYMVNFDDPKQVMISVEVKQHNPDGTIVRCIEMMTFKCGCVMNYKSQYKTDPDTLKVFTRPISWITI